MADVAHATSEVPAFVAFQALLAAVRDDPALTLAPIRERPVDQVTALGGGDYDFILPPPSHDAFLRRLLTAMAAHAVSFTIDHTNPDKRRIELHAPETGGGIVIELWSRLEVSDPARRTARSIPWKALAPRLVRTAAGWGLPLEIEVLYYLSHLASRHKRLDQPEVQRRLAAYRARAAADPALAGLLGRLRADADVAGVAAEANQRLVALGVLAAADGPVARLRQALAAARDRRRRRSRRALARGRIVAVTGPDGVGKTTVIEALRGDLASRSAAYRFKSLFRHNPLYQILHALRFAAVAKAWPGELAKNQFDEIHAPALFRIARFWHPLLRLRGWLRGHQLCDRYYHDLLFADLRRPEGRPRLRDGWERLAATMPLPAWHLHLDAGNEVILARKRELSPAGLDCYRDGLFAIHLAAGTPYFTYLNTARPLAEVRAVLRLAAAPLGLRFRP